MKNIRLWPAVFLTFAHLVALAQATDPDTLTSAQIEAVVVSAARLEAPAERLPFAISVVDKRVLQTAQAQRTLQEALVTVPGVFSLNTDNFSQDLRVSVRGFGARAAFGIRGLRLITDGIPESTPDGSADLDNVDPGALRRMEVLRGTTAGLYGNASGGVLYLTTEEPTERPFVEAQAAAGSFGFYRFQAKGGGYIGKTGVFGSITHQQSDGYRPLSAMQQTTANVKLRHAFSDTSRLMLVANYGYSPVAEDPGGLTAAQVEADRGQTNAANIRFNTGEAVEQGRIGLLWEQRLNTRHSLKVTTFGTTRAFSNRLGFANGGWVEFDRIFGGAGAVHQYVTARYRSQTGVEINGQRDDRRRYNNQQGTKGEQTVHQFERYNSFSGFWINEYAPLKKWIFSGALRLDVLALSVQNRLTGNNAPRDKQDFQRLNPTFGVVWKAMPTLSCYANVASNFETPTLNELSANPASAGGFNRDLQPQQSVTAETGVKMRTPNGLEWETSLFHIDLTNELVPYQLPNEPGRTFFRNAGKSRRQGIETSMRWPLHRHWHLTLHYTYSHFRYRDYVLNGAALDGNQQPLQPRSVGFALLQWTSPTGWYAAAQVRYQGAFYADDVNKTNVPDALLASLRTAYTVRLKKIRLEPFIGADNLFHAAYYNNILINNAFGRFFEPAPVFATFYGGVKVGVGSR
jgi:iron complex outermembrane recepter protein